MTDREKVARWLYRFVWSSVPEEQANEEFDNLVVGKEEFLEGADAVKALLGGEKEQSHYKEAFRQLSGVVAREMDCPFCGAYANREGWKHREDCPLTYAHEVEQ